MPCPGRRGSGVARPHPALPARAAGDALAVARGVTLAVGGADFAEGDPVPAALAFAVGGG